MAFFSLMHQGIEALRKLPLIRQARRAAFDRRFEHERHAHLFRGVFESWDAAVASAPKSVPLGYDNPQSADLYLERLQVDVHDYPALFWLSCSLAEGMKRVADIGGSVGVKYYAFSKLMQFPTGLAWRVIDVPAVAARGRKFAAERGVAGSLEFSDQIADADGMDVLYASGSLQYLPQTLAELVDGFSRKPRRIIVNTTPIHPERSFLTLNSIGTAYCPYRVQARGTFIHGVESVGYSLRDEWQNVGKQLSLPFECGYDLPHYSGFCFDAR